MSEITKNSERIVTIDGYNSSGLGVARIGGHVVFVKNALLGEVCEVKILKVSRDIAYAKTTGIIKRSPRRVEPACENFGKCGGCDFMHMDYDEELELKRARVEDALRRVGGLSIDVPPVAGADSVENYRNKAVYVIGEEKGRAAAGFYRERSHEIVPVKTCAIQADAANRSAAALTKWMDDHQIRPYDETSRTGCIRRLFCRRAAATNTAQIALVAANNDIGGVDDLVGAILENCPETASIAINTDRSRGNAVFSGSFETLWGDSHITDILCGMEFRLSPRSFYQINHSQAERLYNTAAGFAALRENDTALDLYCGAGAITLLLAGYAGRVIGAEIVGDAVADARENAARNGITNAEFICADAASAAVSLKQDNVKPAVVVTDPPRRGLTPETIGAIADLSPERVVYISCDPATLARDLRIFRELGYPLKSIEPFDMFPRCAHIECCCLLTKQ